MLKKQNKLIKLVQNNPKKPLTLKNKANILVNGDKTFEVIFDAIKQAKDHIHLEYYIFQSDTIGSQLIDILCDKAEEGVEVRVIYDYVGSQLKSSAKQKMEDCGIAIYPFMPVWFPNLTRKLNYRNHRKIAIIDGVIGFLGGVNISDDYCNTQNKVFWRDTHLKLEGDAVKSLQSNFLLNWSFVSEGDIDIQDRFFPEVDLEDQLPVQIVASGPDTRWPYIMEAIFMAVVSAKKSIKITTPYFIPNDEILTALKTASRSGIDVTLIIPEEGDSWAAKYATYSYVQELLEADIKVYCYCKGMIHAKVLIVDEEFTTAGTCNMDYRSFNINFEINALFYDKSFASKMTSIFEEDLTDCKQLILEDWTQRPLTKKIKESFNRLWAPLL